MVYKSLFTFTGREKERGNVSFKIGLAKKLEGY